MLNNSNPNSITVILKKRGALLMDIHTLWSNIEHFSEQGGQSSNPEPNTL